MAYGVLIESMIQAKNIDALNRSVKAQIDVAGGGLLVLTAPTTQGNDVWTATAPASGALGGLWIAYNPEVKYTVVNGKKYAGLSADLRDYTNIAGDILESKANQTTFTRIAAATGATAGSTAFEVEWVGFVEFPQAGVGINRVKAFKAVCIQE